jgi:pimeloyl-ACP methyl ester carboxylesterase
VIATINGISIGYDDVGSGMAVAFVHGYPHDRSLWASQLGALAVPARTLACDLRGFGETTGEARVISDYSGDVAAWLRSLDVGSAVIVGLSMGGYVALDLWRTAPELVRALVLVDTRATPDDEQGRAKRDEQIELAKQRGSGPLADQLVQGMLGKSTRRTRPELVERVHAMLARASTAGIVSALAAMRDRPDSTITLPTIDVPTLIVVGDEDVLTPVSDSRSMHEAIDGSRLEVVAGAGHLTPVERPSAFNHLLGEFLSSITYS